MDGESQGCMGFIFKLLRIGGQSQPTTEASQTEALPYRQRDNFLSPAELSFFHVLRQVAANHFHVCAKVRVSDLLYVVQRRSNMGHANRIDRKHVDFVLCNPKTMQPALVVELDDSTHQRKDRQERDELIDAAFAAAELPILHVPCRSSYNHEEIKQLIRGALQASRSSVEAPAPESIAPISVAPSHAPQCPKCNIAMVERTASRGKNKGKRFWACPSYPECRKIIAID